MKKKLTAGETLTVSSMLFGLFFGAGNLIFPAYMGQAAGRNVIPALLGFLISGVGLPLLGVVSLAFTRSSGLQMLSSKAGKKYGAVFTAALYLTIGPLFAIPRCFTVPYETLFSSGAPGGLPDRLALFIFTLVFFAIMMFFSLRPGRIMDWVGKLLNPMFLAMFAWIMGTALIHPMGSAFDAEPAAEYASAPFAKGIFEGYNTMDALAGLAFGIVVVNVINSLGVKEPGDVAANSIKAGLSACGLMALIYTVTALVGAQSRAAYPAASNGSVTLAEIAQHYYHGIGIWLLGIMIMLATLKTAVGLITSCSETFSALLLGKLSYTKWTVIFCLVSLLIANAGLDEIIRFSLPVLMFLYPLAVSLIILAMSHRAFNDDPGVYRAVTAVTFIFAIIDTVTSLPVKALAAVHLTSACDVLARVIPLSSYRLGWLLPTVIALIAAVICGRSPRRCGFSKKK